MLWIDESFIYVILWNIRLYKTGQVRVERTTDYQDTSSFFRTQKRLIWIFIWRFSGCQLTGDKTKIKAFSIEILYLKLTIFSEIHKEMKNKLILNMKGQTFEKHIQNKFSINFCLPITIRKMSFGFKKNATTINIIESIFLEYLSQKLSIISKSSWEIIYY